MAKSMTSFGRSQSSDDKELCFSIEMKPSYGISCRNTFPNVDFPLATFPQTPKISPFCNVKEIYLNKSLAFG